jgi:hypothetical protein
VAWIGLAGPGLGVRRTNESTRRNGLGDGKGGNSPFPGLMPFAKSLTRLAGWVAERFKAPVLKFCRTRHGISRPFLCSPI